MDKNLKNQTDIVSVILGSVGVISLICGETHAALGFASAGTVFWGVGAAYNAGSKAFEKERTYKPIKPTAFSEKTTIVKEKKKLLVLAKLPKLRSEKELELIEVAFMKRKKQAAEYQSIGQDNPKTYVKQKIKEK